MEKMPELHEIVDTARLEQIADLFAAVTGIPLVFTDSEGVAVTPLHDPLQFCGSLVTCPDAPTLCLRRRRWDVPEAELERTLRQKSDMTAPVLHHCRGNFRDSAVPVVVEAQIIGYAVFGRVLTEAPDCETFRSLAEKAGMPPEIGEKVCTAALVISEERLQAVSDFLKIIVDLVASAAYDQLKARRILELEAMRDSLMHMIVHDLRTPLTGIITGLQTVADCDYEAEITREFVPLAASSANVLLEMVNTLLDINKLESGEMKLERTTVQPAALVEQALAQVAAEAQAHGHELSTDLAADCPEIMADDEKLLRVIVNLLGNAVKFTPDGGRITVGTRCNSDGLVVSVSDTGPGIPPEYQEKVFEKFGQVEARQTGRKHSTGLGLTFCKLAVEAHGGRIWVDSEPGAGSTFAFSIPQTPGSGAAPPQ